MEKTFAQLLLGKDRRRLNNESVLTAVHDQKSFDALFGLILHHERHPVMRAADAVERSPPGNRNTSGRSTLYHSIVFGWNSVETIIRKKFF